MENHTTHVVEDLLSWAKTLTFDLPLTGTQWAFDTGKEEAMTESAWHGYDAGARVLTSTIDTLYRLPLLDHISSQDKQDLLFPVGHMGLAVSSTAHKELWPQVCRWLAEQHSNHKPQFRQ